MYVKRYSFISFILPKVGGFEKALIALLSWPQRFLLDRGEATVKLIHSPSPYFPFSSFLPTTVRPLCLSCPFLPNAGQEKRDDNEMSK